MLIFLIGQSGSGKSYWANALAPLLHITHLDMDKMIADKHHKSITAIFNEHGASFFREEERRLLLSIIGQYQAGAGTGAIVATGGGTPCYNQNMDLMLQHGTVIYLEAPVALLAQRLAHTSDRPLLANDNHGSLLRELQAQLNERKTIYERAHFTVDAATATSATFAAIIQSACSQK